MLSHSKQSGRYIKAAEAVVCCLEEQGVKYIFGYPGGAVLDLYEALRGSKIKHVLTRHEQAAAHAADGYARVSGKVGVCLATSGPGACNLVTGLATAYMDSVPLVAITGQVATDKVGTDAFQEVDITGITMPITKHNYLVKSAEDIPRIFGEAFHIASTGRPGPVLIDIPCNVAGCNIEYCGIPKVNLRGYRPTYKGHPNQIINAVKMIMQAKCPVIYVGGGILRSGAAEQLRAMAELTNIPVAVTLNALGAFPSEHRLFLGMLGIHGTKYANLAVKNCDCLIALGCRFDERVTNNAAGFAEHSCIIHIDIDPAEIGKNIKVDLPLVGDIKTVLQDMLLHLEAKCEQQWLERIDVWKRQFPLEYETQVGSDAMKPQQVIEALYERLGSEVVIASDVGQHQMWTAQYYKFARPRSFISSGGLGTMGYALPAAVGAKFGLQDSRPVVVICGDGGFQMNMAEIATAVENRLDIKIFIINNRRLNMVRQLQEVYYQKHYMAVDFQFTPAFEKLGEVFGILGLAVRNKEQLAQALDTVFTVSGSAIVNCLVDEEENVEPMLLAGCTITD